ncbi:hypothetical protein B0A52_03280 [Exophiala mesophila]|uniref:Uncharacterized protein n=1 Tax=Exophiala mesophila TaxID=212818 RepID=A0A438NBB2_EXOME|nr:hypothetical protein B0A52_03280 [Exophiala mesophila]
MDEDQPHPRKRSRFFDSASGSLSVGPSPSRNVIPARQPTHTNTNSSFQSQQCPSLNTVIPDNPPQSPSQNTAENLTHNHRNPVPENEQETEVGDDRDPDSKDQSAGGDTDQENNNPQTGLTSRFGQLTIRNSRANRPTAVYGYDDLLAANSNHRNRRSSTFDQPPKAEDERNGPPLIEQNLTSRPRQFTFRADQQIAPHAINYRNPNLGHGLAQIAQATYHRDTGPLAGSQVRNPQPNSNPQSKPRYGIITGHVDIDRDELGRPLVRPGQPRTTRTPLPGMNPNCEYDETPDSSGFTPLLPHMKRVVNPDTLVPDHLYNAPGRLEHARYCAIVCRKRKRSDVLLPPPAYVYQRTNSPSFDILNAFMLYPELLYALAGHLPVKDLENLYCISKDFHTLIDARFTTVMLAQALNKAPESARTYPFRCYRKLCRDDPAARIPHPNTALAANLIPRCIPSFRWLKMIMYREKVVHELMTVFAEDGVPLPHRCSLALKRMWFMMDVPDNARRVGLVHQRSFMTDLDLYFLACFFVKLDMRLNDPTRGEKSTGMRRLLLSQRSLTTILKFLKREIWTTRFDVMKVWIRTFHQPPPDEVGLSLCGIPADQIGRSRLEYWGIFTEAQLKRSPKALYRPDTLVAHESHRRGLKFQKHYLRFLLYGYVRPDTLEDYAPRTYGRRIGPIREDEYDIDDVVGGVAALSAQDEMVDPLLDLGRPRLGSVFTIQKDPITAQEKKLRSEQLNMAQLCVEWWEKESAEGVRMEA